MALDCSFERMIAFASDLIQIPSPSGEEAAVAERVVQEMRQLGFDQVWVDEVGNVIGRIRGRARWPQVMLCSHLDVVAGGDPAQWPHPPFGGVVADGFLYGRGAMDCKGPLALQTYAAAQFRDEPPAGDIYVAHTVFEERGCWGVAHLMERNDIRPSVVVLGEATSGDVCVGHRGRSELIVVIRGKSAHASAPSRANNPMDLLPAIIGAIQVFADRLPEHPFLGRSTLAPSVIESYPTNHNMTPEEVRIVIDWRTVPGSHDGSAADALRRAIRAHVPDDAPCSVDVVEACETQRAYTGRTRTASISTPGFLLDADDPLVLAAVRTVHDGTGRRPAVRPWTFGTDGGHACGLHGVPTLGYAPGHESDAHTNHERLHLDGARVAYTIYPRLITALEQALMAAVPLDAAVAF